MDYKESKEVEPIYFKTLYLGLFLNVFIPAILVFLGLFLKSKGVGADPIKSIDLVLFVLLAASGIEVLFILFFKKQFFSKAKSKSLDASAPEKNNFFRLNLVLFSLSLTPSIYGFVYFLLGGELRWFLLFVAITLLCFRIFKPDLDKTQNFLEQ